MRIFLDTEYTNPTDRDLISIGLISEDGKYELYLERSDFPLQKCTEFVVAHVLPLLGKNQQAVVPTRDFRVRLSTWFRTLPRSVQIAADSRIDFALLRGALGSDPINLNIQLYDLRPLIDTTTYHIAVERYYDGIHRLRHHSMHDARAHRQGFLAWADEKKRSKHDMGSHD